MKKTYKIRRFYRNKHKTLSNCVLEQENGRILVDDICGIELPWKKNKRNISCIPAGIYQGMAIERHSNGEFAIWILDVPGRSEILVHAATFVRNLLGCKAPGTNFADIDNDGIIDVENSRIIMNELKKHIPLWSRITVKITEDFPEPIKRLNFIERLLRIKIPKI